MAWKRLRPWVGGYVRQREEGGPEVFVIERWVGGRRFHVSTRCHTESAAVKQLARFEANPKGYHPAGTPADVPLLLTAELVADYRAHQEAKGSTVEHIDEMTRCLGDWTEKLGAKDLRTLSLVDDLKPALAKWPRRKDKRIKALKGLFKYLRQEKGLVQHHQDATVDLRVPQSDPAKWSRRKVVAPEAVKRVLAVLPQPYRDMLHLLTATAWHCTELARYARSGEEVTPVTPGGPIAVLVTRQKSGEMTRTRLDFVEHLQAARRLQAVYGAGCHPWPKRMTLARVMRKACLAAGVPAFGMGVMRHSVLTWGYEGGAEMAALKDFAQHKSESTTRRFYVDAAAPSGRIPILRLLP